MPSLRVLPVLNVLATAGVVLNGRRLRARAELLHGVECRPQQPVDTTGWRVVAASGVTLHPRTLPAVVAWAEREGLDAVDLVPGDLPVQRALDLLRQVDTETYRNAPTAQGRTAAHALVVRDAVAERAELPTGQVPPAELVEVAQQVKRYAPRTHDLVVAPCEQAKDWSHDEQLAVQRALFDRYGAVNLTALAGQLALMGLGAVRAKKTGLAALAAYQAQPAVVLGGRPGGMVPKDLGKQTVTRWASEARRWVGLRRADAPQPKSLRMAEELRPYYEAEIAQGTDRFFEAPVEKCRWCGSTELSLLFTTPDLIQHKPGEFRLDECRTCGHVFQNPRLTPEGLDFYYRDCYDGYGGDEMERMFASQQADYESRASMVQAVDPSPARWLDVGSGHAHFCLVAREQFPGTSFEGLDMGSEIDEAAHRGWVDRSYRGMFPEVAPDLAGEFDVVSMHHYLEHTREPVEELDAARTALKPGGLLMIEVPDPEYGPSRRLGRYWMPWLQPQHQQFISMGRLEQALTERGFTVLDRWHAEPKPGFDVVVAAWFMVGHRVPRLWAPWRRKPTVGDRVTRVAAVSAAIPVATVAAVAAEAMKSKDEGQRGPAYRVLARLG